MKKKNQHVLPIGKGWFVKATGESLPTIITRKQSEAIKIARCLAQNNQSDLVVHGKDGKVRQRKNYKNYPSAFNPITISVK